MRRALRLLACAAVLAPACLAAAADAAPPAAAGPAATFASGSIATGQAAFQRVCAPCHAKGPGLDGSPMLPGAAALAIRHQGAVSPFLEERSDLGAEVIRVFVRQGVGTMPMFRKTEISDAEIAAIAAYLAASARGQ
ncbi:MAG: cytochrome c [Gammaproteobacteria bacterium]|nr:cytochrome c [Gammaproteobacteria bacterium]